MALDVEDVGDAARSAPKERGLRRIRAPAGDDDNVGMGAYELRDDADGDRVVVSEHPSGAGNAHAAQKPMGMMQRHAPRSAGNRFRRVEHEQIDLVARRDAIEERRPVRRRLGRHDRDTRHASTERRAARRTAQSEPCARSNAAKRRTR